MIHSGTRYKILKRGFRPATKLSVLFTELDSGNVANVKRAVVEDVYKASFEIYGTKTEITGFIQASNVDTANNGYMTLQFVNEPVYGANIDYTQPLKNIVNLKPLKQKTITTFSLTVESILIDPVFLSGSTLPNFKYLDIGYNSIQKTQINYDITVNNKAIFYKQLDDSRSFNGSFLFTDEDMKNLKNWYRINRGDVFSLSNISGVNNPFGLQTGTYPFNVRIVSIKEEWYCVGFWKANVTFILEND